MEPSQHKRPLWLGVLLASLALATCISVVALISQSRAPSFTQLVGGLGAVFAVAVPVSLVAMLCFGLPFVLWLRSRNALNSVYVCAGAALIGAATFALFGWWLTWDHRLPGVSLLLFGAGIGIVSGVAFCVGSGPNNSFKPKPLRGSA